MPERLRKLGESHGLTMLGFVEDLVPYLEVVRYPLRRCGMGGCKAR